MDLIGKLAQTKDGYQYICVMVDYFTKWPQAYPLRSKSAADVTACILKFVYQFESPKRILTDQGKEFVNAINKRVCEMLDIKRSLCSPYHPQTNGLVGKLNGTIQRALSKVVCQHPESWDEYLDAVMFGLRTKKQMTTNYSPYFLMFGREARYPIQVPEHYEVDGTVEDVVGMEVMAQDHNEQDQLFEQVREHIRKAQEKTRHPKTTSGTTPTVHIGDLVLRQNIRSQQRKGGKLSPNFLGPYKIVAIEGKTADLQDENGALVPKINIDHLKPYKENKQRVPHRYENKKGASSWMTQSPSPPASAPPASAPPATAPPAIAPPTTAPSSTAPPAAAPPSTAATAPPASAPPAIAPSATAPPASAPPTTAPSPTAPPAAAPPTTAPSPTAPPAAAPPSTAPTATAPLASAPPAIAPSATAPPASAPPTTAPSPTAPPAAAPPTTAPSPAAPPAAAPPTTAPSPTAPPAAAPPTTTPSPTAPPAASPPSTAPTATAPPASAPPSTAPTATAPPASAPPATAPSATAPSATDPPATAPFSPALNTATPPQLSLTFRQTRENVDKYVQDAWKGKHVHVLLSKIGAYKLFFWDIMNVRPNSELESEVKLCFHI
ncbi:protein transport protein SEC31-like [Syngnathus acus]|uniref:protein transport protein SEC31-like n=1 Tax=Syngnathus acus TaxID=161584 RepID=UPI0018860713|nr:protein transport protein SEC31-like [Syngnathus acus]